MLFKINGLFKDLKGTFSNFHDFSRIQRPPIFKYLLKPVRALNFPLFSVSDKSGSGKLLFSRIIQENIFFLKYFIKPVQTLNTAILPLVPGVCLVKVV